MSATACAEDALGNPRSAAVSRVCAVSWCPRSCSIPAHAPTRLNLQRRAVAGRQGDCFEQRSTAVLEPPGGGLRASERHQELDALCLWRALAAGDRARSRTSARRSVARDARSPRRPRAAPQPPPGRHGAQRARCGAPARRPVRRAQRARRRCGRGRRAALPAGHDS